jgi:membrane protease YdiL (CAAX protease family)
MWSKKWLYVIGIVIVLSTEFGLRDVLLPENPTDFNVQIATIGELMLSILLFFWILKVEGNRLESIGFGKLRLRYLWIGVFSFLILMVASLFVGLALEAVGLETLASLQPIIREYNFLTLILLFFIGTFLEEIFYRGYLIERLTSLTGKSWLAGIVSWITFTFVHLKFFGLGPTINVGVTSAVLVLLYLKERSIWACIVVHGINSVLVYLVTPLLTS